jgi:hypothetical protein
LSSSSDDLARISHLLGRGALSEQHQAECDGSSSSRSVAILICDQKTLRSKTLCTVERPAAGEPHECRTGLAMHLDTAESRSLRWGQLHQLRELVRVHASCSNTTETHRDANGESDAKRTQTFSSFQSFSEKRAAIFLRNDREMWHSQHRMARPAFGRYIWLELRIVISEVCLGLNACSTQKLWKFSKIYLTMFIHRENTQSYE